METTETTTQGLVLTDSAAQKVKALLDAEGQTDLALRVAVRPGGCAGFQYDLFFDATQIDGDVRKSFGGVNVVIDKASIEYVNGAVIDYVDSLSESGFKIENPNAAGGCGCGKSFC